MTISASLPFAVIRRTLVTVTSDSFVVLGISQFRTVFLPSNVKVRWSTTERVLSVSSCAETLTEFGYDEIA